MSEGLIPGDSREVAERRAREITVYWREQGYEVYPDIVKAPYAGHHSVLCWFVRLPSFPRGMPPKECKIANWRKK